MKKLHLLCNAHLNPAWLWEWNEGLAEALSTFRVAANFCEKYDGFVFNHNESVLYEWVEEYEPELFERIKKLVAQGKWKIMGGWYLQPDCVMPSGESLLSQIELGRDFFMSRFGKKPTTAINFDPFGHTRGLVQILNLSGYDSYIFMRPQSFHGDFWWEGFDGSKILAHGIFGAYSTLKGEAVNRIDQAIKWIGKDVGLCLWGIGNHGGGPSEIDLNRIAEYMSNSEVEIIHSDAESYCAETDKSNLNVCRTSLIPSMVGCYTSMVRIKQAHRRLENKIAVAEKIMSYADLETGLGFCEQEMKKAKKALAFCEFHDILPGSAIKRVEEDSLRTFAYGEEIVDKLYNKAFFRLCNGQAQAKAGTIPIMVFNPHPYEIEGEFEIGFMLENQNWDENTVTQATVFCEDGTPLPTQNEKPDCTFSLDWIQKICFRAKLAPSGVTRFNCELKKVNKSEMHQIEHNDRNIEINTDRMKVTINRKSGLIENYWVDGKLLIEQGGKIEVYKDNEDPWGMNVSGFKDYEGEFELMKVFEANEFAGYPNESFPAVRVTEDGAVRTKVQALFKYKGSKVVVEYTLPKKDIYIDVKVTILSNEPNKMVKYHIPSAFKAVPVGQTAFGREELFNDQNESVFHKWCALFANEGGLAVLNNGIYGGSFSESSIKLSLLRTPSYSTHPIQERPLAPHDRVFEHIDMGERVFNFRITTVQDLERKAQAFNEVPQLLSFFPSGNGEKPKSVVSIDNPNILLSSMRKKNGKYILTLFNSGDSDCKATLILRGQKTELEFGKYQVKIIEQEL